MGDEMDMGRLGNKGSCGYPCCELPRRDCLEDIACSQLQVADCEADLFCDIASRLRCEIRHARCIGELEHLLHLTNEFLSASAVKEEAIGDILASLRDKVKPER